MVEVGSRYALRYERDHGIAIQTYLYRVMRRRYPDYLRVSLGDSRAVGRRRRVPVSACVPLRELDGAVWWDDNGDNLDEAIGNLAERLSAASRHTLRTIAVPISAGCEPIEIARRLGMRSIDVEQRLERLREELVRDSARRADTRVRGQIGGC